MSKTASVWKEFNLTVTDPPRYTGHFELIKNELIPFVDKYSLSFWITNYHNATSDFILFRVKCTKCQSKQVKDFLDKLKGRHLIVNWRSSPWSPRDDAGTRIGGLPKKVSGFDPNKHMIVGYSNGKIVLAADRNIGEKQEQLAALFEALGDCTKAIYKHLNAKPKDLWISSVFIHLLLNSIDYSGPAPSSEEDSIRAIPPL